MVYCPRCGGPALLAVEVGSSESAVLCAQCDLDHPTGGPVVLWFAVNGRINTPAQVEELAALLLPWVETVSPPSVDGTALQATVDAWAASVAAPTATGAGLMCDFCEAAVPRWAYRAGPAVSVPAGDWFACDDCRPYVDAREWAALAGMVGGDRTEAWVAFADAEPRAARPWPPRARIYRWP
ncbi:DUF6300 family protein [Cryptosporangium minutisporangium]|uniref:Uncharacterized protein n=1 Tax=Cryptosporangium minutisporangium TaxID=113569 RepID=A0ABP6T8T4_9ACTN